MTDAQSESGTPMPDLDEYEYEPGDVFRGMGGDYWMLTARLWNFDVTEYDRIEYGGEKFEVTEDRHRREYVLSNLGAMGAESLRLHESDLIVHMFEASKEEAREHYWSKEDDDAE